MNTPEWAKHLPREEQFKLALQIFLDAIHDDPAAVQFFDLRMVAWAKELVREE